MFNKQPTKSKLVPGVGRVPFPAYRGTEKFIFVSYAHKDEDNVFPEIIRFQNMKYNVWYDEILSPGNEWKKDVAEHLLDSDLFIIFMSNNSAVSRNCRKEFYCALEHNKHIIPFYLEDFNTIEIDSEWKADLSEIQGILMTNLNEEEYIYKFSEAFKKFDFNYGGVEISQNIIEELQKNLNEFDSVDWKFVTPYIGGTFIDMNA